MCGNTEVVSIINQLYLSGKDTIQNFQLVSVRCLTYSSNISLIWSALCLVTGTPVAGNWDWQILQIYTDNKWGNKTTNHCITYHIFTLYQTQLIQLGHRSWETWKELTVSAVNSFDRTEFTLVVNIILLDL